MDRMQQTQDEIAEENKRLREGGAAFTLVPVCVSMKRLTEPVHEGTAAKQQNRSPLVRMWEQEFREHPAQADMLKQAMGMRALVIVVEVEDEGELNELSEAVLEDLRTNRTVITCSRPEVLPLVLRERCEPWNIAALGLYLNDLKMVRPRSRSAPARAAPPLA